MTKKHFIDAAAMVRNILEGHWSFDPPPWADGSQLLDIIGEDTDSTYTRAVWTAEAFILLFSAANSRFDTSRFLIACGLAEKPAKTRKVKR